MAMNERAERLQVWLGALCGIAVVAAVVLAGPYLFAESTRAARPAGAVALRSLVWMVLAFAAWWVLIHQPRLAQVRRAIASGRGSSRGRR